MLSEEASPIEWTTKSIVEVMARSKAVLPAPFGPIRTTTLGSRTSGRERLSRKRGRLGVVLGMRKSSSTSSRIDWRYAHESVNHIGMVAEFCTKGNLSHSWQSCG